MCVRHLSTGTSREKFPCKCTLLPSSGMVNEYWMKKREVWPDYPLFLVPNVAPPTRWNFLATWRVWVILVSLLLHSLASFQGMRATHKYSLPRSNGTSIDDRRDARFDRMSPLNEKSLRRKSCRKIWRLQFGISIRDVRTYLPLPEKDEKDVPPRR